MKQKNTIQCAIARTGIAKSTQTGIILQADSDESIIYITGCFNKQYKRECETGSMAE